MKISEPCTRITHIVATQCSNRIDTDLREKKKVLFNSNFVCIAAQCEMACLDHMLAWDIHASHTVPVVPLLYYLQHGGHHVLGQDVTHQGPGDH